MQLLDTILFGLAVAAPALAPAVPKGVVSVDVTKKKVTLDEHKQSLSGRDDSLPQATLDNHQTQYWTTIQVGTPGQDVEVQLDTGSSLLWVHNGTGSGYFDSLGSKTFNITKKDGFQVGYVNVGYHGDWATDTVSWNGISIDDVAFGSVHGEKSRKLGLFGIARVGSDTIAKNGVNRYYPYLLKDKGYIDYVSYSLHLNSPASKQGTLLFGGFDKSKYTGKLAIVPFTTGGFEVNYKFNGKATKGVLDSGADFHFVADDIFDDFFYSHPELNLTGSGWQYTTKTKPQGEGITLTFNDTDIKIPMEYLFNYDETKSEYKLGVLPSNLTGGANLLGDTFLRAAYVVYDLEGAVAGIGQAAYNNDKSEVVVISDGLRNAVQ